MELAFLMFDSRWSKCSDCQLSKLKNILWSQDLVRRKALKKIIGIFGIPGIPDIFRKSPGPGSRTFVQKSPGFLHPRDRDFFRGICPQSEAPGIYFSNIRNPERISKHILHISKTYFAQVGSLDWLENLHMPEL